MVPPAQGRGDVLVCGVATKRDHSVSAAAFIECLTRRKRHSAVERKIDQKADGGRQLYTRQHISASLVPEIIPPSLLLGLGSTVAAAGVRVHVVGLLSSQAEQTREQRPVRGYSTPRTH